MSVKPSSISTPPPAAFDGPDFEIDHIGIAVESLAESLSLYKAMGWSSFHEEVVPGEKVRVAFVSFKNSANIELLEATSPDSVIRKFIDRRGPGVHHICFRVKDLNKVLARLGQQQVRLIDEKPRLGAYGCQVAFVHPASCNGVLIELSEKGH